EKFVAAFLDKHVEHGLFKCQIGRMAVRFPVAIKQIDLDATTDWIFAIDANCGIAKIGPGLAVPNAKLDDVDLIARSADKMFPEISCEPARLQFQLRWNPR